MAQWQHLESTAEAVEYTFALSQSPESVEALLERRLHPDGSLDAALVLTDVHTGEALARTALQGPCNWGDLSAQFDPSTKQLHIRIALQQPGSSDSLRQVAAGGGAAAAAAAADMAAGANGTAAVAHASNASSSSTDSLVSAVSELPMAPEVNEQPARKEGRTGASAAAALGAPATPLLSEEAEAGAAAPSREASQQEDDAAGEGGEAESAAAKKKKKKKKKKKGGAAAAAATDGEAAAGEREEEGEGEAEGEAAAAAGEAQAAAAGPEAPAAAAPEPAQRQAEAEEHGQPAAEAAMAGPEAAAADEAPTIPGRTELGAAVPQSQFSGPVVREALSKDRKKDSGGGEDQWLIKPSNAWGLEGVEGSVPFSAFGVFDGHGGRSVATFASNALIKAVMAEVDRSPLPLQEVPEVEGLSAEDELAWRLQATLMARLPQACSTAFKKVDADAQRRWPDRGGTTATLAVACGWELLVANVGDSCAYLDTGSEVLQVSATHRLEDNKEEVARCKAAGCEIAPSTVEGKPAGPIRVWPGGLNMARTIGDAEAGEAVTAEPEVCQVTLPATGARLLIGSDGLWDAVHPKTAAHHTREMTAAEAAHKLLALAIRADKLKDDVTVVVVDFLPDAAARLPPGFAIQRAQAAAAGKKAGTAEVVHLAHVWHPLRESWDYLAAGAERRRQALEGQRLAEAEAAAEAERARERQQEAFTVMLKKAAREGHTAETLHMYEGMSDTYRELASLTLSPADLQAELDKAKAEAEAELRQEMEGEWQEVRSAEDEQQQQPASGGRDGGRSGRGRGRGGRFEPRGGRGEEFGGRARGRGRGRGRQPEPPTEHEFSPADGEAAAAAGTEAPGQPAAEAAPPQLQQGPGGEAALPQREQRAPGRGRDGGRGRGRYGGGGRYSDGSYGGRGRGRYGGGGRYAPSAPGHEGQPAAALAAPAAAAQPGGTTAAPGGYVPPNASAETANLYFRPPPVRPPLPAAAPAGTGEGVATSPSAGRGRGRGRDGGRGRGRYDGGGRYGDSSGRHGGYGGRHSNSGAPYPGRGRGPPSTPPTAVVDPPAAASASAPASQAPAGAGEGCGPGRPLGYSGRGGGRGVPPARGPYGRGGRGRSYPPGGPGRGRGEPPVEV